MLNSFALRWQQATNAERQAFSWFLIYVAMSVLTSILVYVATYSVWYAVASLSGFGALFAFGQNLIFIGIVELDQVQDSVANMVESLRQEIADARDQDTH